jgi:hypothetical protein
MSEGENRGEEEIGSEETKNNRGEMRDGVALTPDEARLHDEITKRLQESEKLEAEVQQILQDTTEYQIKFNEIKTVAQKILSAKLNEIHKAGSGDKPDITKAEQYMIEVRAAVLELGTTEEAHNTTLKKLLENLEKPATEKTPISAKECIPSELYSEYIENLRSAIEFSDTVLAYYRSQFGLEPGTPITGDALDLSNLNEKLDKIADLIEEQAKKSFPQIASSRQLAQWYPPIAPEKKAALDSAVRYEKLGFDALDSRVFQRFPRYAMLFKEFAKRTKTYDDISPDIQEFRQYLSDKKIRNIDSISVLDSHLLKFLDWKANERLEKIDALVGQTNTLIGKTNDQIARINTGKKEAEETKTQQGKSGLTRTLTRLGTLSRRASSSPALTDKTFVKPPNKRSNSDPLH